MANVSRFRSLKIRCTQQGIFERCFYFDLEISEIQGLSRGILISISNNGLSRFCEVGPFKSSYSFGPVTLGSPKTTITLVVDKTGSPKTILRQLAVSKQLLDSISGMNEQDPFTDFTFVVKGKDIQVHRSILAAFSPVMRKLFTAQYKEKETSTCIVDNIKPNVFEALIRFMYTCTVPENLGDLVYELYAAAHYYDVQTMKDICLAKLQNNLSKETAVEVYALAFKYDLKKLSTDAWEIIKRWVTCYLIGSTLYNIFRKNFSDVLELPLEHVEPLSPDEIAKILELREKTDAEVMALRQKSEAKVQKLLKNKK